MSGRESFDDSAPGADQTTVIFRKWKSNSHVIAFFPEIVDGSYVLSYEHVGQHGRASYPHPQTVPAKPQEYEELRRELVGLGYNLKIVRLAGRKS